MVLSCRATEDWDSAAVPPRSSRRQQVVLLGNRPHKADEFPRHRGHGFLTALASIDQSSKPARQALLRSLGNASHAGRHPLSTRLNPLRGAGRKR